MDGGTLYPLRNKINRRNVSKDPSGNATACEEFFLLVTEAHVLAATQTIFQMNSLHDTPKSPHFRHGCLELSHSEMLCCVSRALSEMLEKIVDLSFCQHTQPAQSVHDDCVQSYACDVITLGLFVMEFNDAIREGDGTRIIRCWRYLLLLFKASNRTNYAIEAFTLLAQFDYLLPHQLARQLAWSRTINTHGRPGKNISCDLHMEHLNREAKSQLSGLGSNITNAAVTRIGNALGEVVCILENFDNESGIKRPSARHSKRSSEKDMAILLKQLQETSKVFYTRSGRIHQMFPKFNQNLMNSLCLPDLMQWMGQQLHKIKTYN